MTLTVSPSGPVIKGSTVNLTCSSDANPPVTQGGYSLYQGREIICSGQNHIIPDIQPSQSGWYHCRAGNTISQGGSNLRNSAEVHIDVLCERDDHTWTQTDIFNIQWCDFELKLLSWLIFPDGPMNISVSVSPHETVEGSRVNLTCSCAANPEVNNYTWLRKAGAPGSSSMVQVGSGQVLSLNSMGESHRGLYLCHVRNELGESNSPEMMLSVMGKQKGLWLYLQSWRRTRCLRRHLNVKFWVFLCRKWDSSDLSWNWSLSFGDVRDSFVSVLVSKQQQQQSGWLIHVIFTACSIHFSVLHHLSVLFLLVPLLWCSMSWLTYALFKFLLSLAQIQGFDRVIGSPVCLSLNWPENLINRSMTFSFVVKLW